MALVPNRPNEPSARAYALLSVGAALATIALKTSAYLVTGSVGLLSDAVESLINLAAALVAIWALTLASRPPDAEHAYSHAKAEYFASAVEGVLILIAAVGIGLTAWERLLHLRSLEQVWLGLTISLVAATVNGAVALVMLRAGRRLHSITLVADAHHLLTDVWTSAGVVIGVVLVQLTSWLPLDPLIALLVAANIVWTGCGCCAIQRMVSWIPHCRPPTRHESPRYLHRTKNRGSSFTPYGRAPPASAALCRCTFWCQEDGRSSAGMRWPIRSNARSSRRSQRRPYSPTSSCLRILSPGMIRPWIASKAKRCPQIIAGRL